MGEMAIEWRDKGGGGAANWPRLSPHTWQPAGWSRWLSLRSLWSLWWSWWSPWLGSHWRGQDYHLTRGSQHDGHDGHHHDYHDHCDHCVHCDHRDHHDDHDDWEANWPRLPRHTWLASWWSRLSSLWGLSLPSNLGCDYLGDPQFILTLHFMWETLQEQPHNHFYTFCSCVVSDLSRTLQECKAPQF